MMRNCSDTCLLLTTSKDISIIYTFLLSFLHVSAYFSTHFCLVFKFTPLLLSLFYTTQIFSVKTAKCIPVWTINCTSVFVERKPSSKISSSLPSRDFPRTHSRPQSGSGILSPATLLGGCPRGRRALRSGYAHARRQETAAVWRHKGESSRLGELTCAVTEIIVMQRTTSNAQAHLHQPWT